MTRELPGEGGKITFVTILQSMPVKHVALKYEVSMTEYFPIFITQWANAHNKI